MCTQINNPFLTKIIFEPQLVENEFFGVVLDIEPIAPEHYMLYSKACYPSLADCPIDVSVFLETSFTNKVYKPYAFFERGRASFCTSMNGVQHGHGHLVPCFSQNMSNLFPYGKIETYDSLKVAYRNINCKGQYLLWGNIGKEFYVLQNIEMLPKRIIRNTVKTQF